MFWSKTENGQHHGFFIPSQLGSWLIVLLHVLILPLLEMMTLISPAEFAKVKLAGMAVFLTP
ncbi:hypothetical protein XNW1_1450032 [Xenorhabdus nematophila str. Websteri]|nr:hypothetical protein XNW1_1450032 [Xenorhabdus nematophila str. Websteri]